MDFLLKYDKPRVLANPKDEMGETALMKACRPGTPFSPSGPASLGGAGEWVGVGAPPRVLSGGLKPPAGRSGASLLPSLFIPRPSSG